jgi:penicillin-binding protein 1C
VKNFLRRAAIAAALLAAVALAVRLWPHAPLSARVPVSSAVFARDGELLRLTLAADGQYRLWTAFEQIAPEYLQALQLYEDRHFSWHPGVDPAALLRATWRSLRGDRQGGSTLTMQLARKLYRLDTRSASGKLRQIVMAVWLEGCYSKHDILEAYANVAPFGGNVQGVGAASLIHFGKPASALTFAEALTLAVIPQAPHARGSTGRESPALTAARNLLLNAWTKEHAVPPEAHAAAARPMLLKGTAQLPFEAPHLANAVLARRAPGAQVRTSIDLPLQQLLERVVEKYIDGVRDLGVTNAAALLVDSRSMTARAVIGSADFHNADIAGQVNGVTAKRSPGSALKPFIYALAMDQGLIHTDTVLKDAPTSFGIYSPENFDGRFVGPVTAHDALIASRNVPAVALSARLSQPGLHQFLKSGGVSRMASERHYGLALALGGGEVTMEELAALYGVLANDGVYAPMRYQDGDAPPAPGTPLLSPAAAFMVRSILADAPRPDGLSTTQQAVAWKTGTSWGFRDAWTAGTFGPWVLVVWVGNFDGSSNPAFVGAQVAAPLFFRIADALRQSGTPSMDRLLVPPASVLRVEVCAASGDLPNADCPRRAHAWYIPGKSPIRVSNVHRRVPVDVRTGNRACAGTPERHVRHEVFEFWPSDIQRLFALAGMPRRRPPDDQCRGKMLEAQNIAPVVTSPRTGAAYQMRAAQDMGEALALNATAGPGVKMLYWFADGGFVGASRPSVALPWQPEHAGEISLSVVDDQGGSSSRIVRIATLQ